ncbi:MAG: PD40 domain-containing protein, partial [Anaerolineae bacterium]|nr:PD40 domain-containing protein [Anaerolineae bacterium]
MKFTYMLVVGVILLLTACQNAAEELPPPSRVAFISDRDGNFEIYVMDRTGENLTRLTEDEIDQVLPTWSAQSDTYVFVGGQAEQPEKITLYRMDNDGGNLRPLNDSAPTPTDYPAWSPTGEWVAYSSADEGNTEVYIVDAAGEKVINLTNNPADDNFAAWSPDGQSLA